MPCRRFKRFLQKKELRSLRKESRACGSSFCLLRKWVLPDPSTLPQNSNSWLCESEGITSWPQIFLSDITVLLMNDHPGREISIHERVLNEYKERKAYRLFEPG